ncbi:hypothetical protein TSOC_011420 [Tetrabaena socialis]|uniref:Uncharacterized protein n=1 Tax=Tetrabaena socialis TaxID=47790 RepID=A0A2J7ZQQ0_9CHLO|nr:hypothetical protein TSOC_011420 [Tetrabaena socialis]|eukprot:PNH02598.1 hypothetical protein TSOC_011420 [Tetrabaena socialis]
MTLDEAMIKQYTGGAGVIVEGRHLGSANTFRYVWQAGFMLIFNEGCCPKFDVGDAAFAGRMIVAPMRSKFVARELTSTEEPYTYKMDKELSKHFPTWMSSFADLLLEHFDINGLDDDRIPDVMKEWQKDILADSNPIAHWMGTHVQITGRPEDFVVLGQLHALCAKGATRPFQKWVAMVDKEIRITGKYELEQQWNQSACV